MASTAYEAADRLRLRMDATGDFRRTWQSVYTDDVTGDQMIVVICDGQEFGPTKESMRAIVVRSASRLNDAQIDAHADGAVADFNTREQAEKDRLGV